MQEFEAAAWQFDRLGPTAPARPGQEAAKPTAGEYFESISRQESALNICREVLESTSAPLAQFHASRILCSAALARWGMLQPNE